MKTPHNLILTFFIAIVFCSLAHAQTPGYRWTFPVGETKYDDASKITGDKAGYIYFGGDFYDTITLGNTTLIPSGIFANDNDAYIVKADSLGNIIWAKQIGGNSGQYVSGLGTDDSCNLYVTGIFSNMTIIGNDTLIPASTSGNDIFIAKYDSSGNFKWARKEGSTGDDKSYDLCVDKNGNVFITGTFFGSFTFGNTPLVNAGQYDIFVAKYDRDGNPIWTNQAGGTHSDYGYGIACDTFGNIYVTGGFGSFGYSATFGNTTLTPVGGMDVYLAKYSNNGNFIWVRQGGGNGNSSGGWGDLARQVTTDRSGNIFITGIFWTHAYFGSDTIISAGMGDTFIAKYDSTGTVLWVVDDGGAAGDEGLGLTTDSSGNVYVGGYYFGNAFFGNTLLMNPGSNRFMFIVKYDGTGTPQWAKQAGDPTAVNSTQAADLATSNSEIYAVGNFTGASSFDSNTIYSHGNADGFFFRLGNPLVTEIMHENIDGEFYIYPNPSQGNVTLHFDVSEKSAKEIIVRNLAGQICFQGSATKDISEVSIDLGDFSSGVYVVQVITNNHCHSEKIVIQ